MTKKKDHVSGQVENIVSRRWKQDSRPQKGWWAPGSYLGKCKICGDDFIGDKRAGWCADCAYKEKAC